MTSTVVLAAGLGSRIRAVSAGLPKPLIPIEGKSVIARNLEWLAASGVASAFVNLHYQASAIRETIGNGNEVGIDITYIVEEQLLGTAGTVRSLLPRLEDPILVVYGDSLVRFDLSRLRDAHAHSDAEATLALFDPACLPHSGIAGGTVSLDARGRVLAFNEGRTDGRYVNAGVYLLRASMLAGVDGRDPLDFGSDLFPRLLAQGRHLHGYVFDEGHCLGLDTPQSLQATRDLVAQGRVALR